MNFPGSFGSFLLGLCFEARLLVRLASTGIIVCCTQLAKTPSIRLCVYYCFQRKYALQWCTGKGDFLQRYFSRFVFKEQCFRGIAESKDHKCYVALPRQHHFKFTPVHSLGKNILFVWCVLWQMSKRLHAKRWNNIT